MGFDWTNVPSPVARGLAKSAGLSPTNAAGSLRDAFGAVPAEEFVNQMWHALRDEWLQRDRAAAKELAMRLKNRGVGRSELPIRNHEQRMAYLRSCRISNAVREEALAVFLSAGGSASEPPAPTAAAPKVARKAEPEVTDDDTALDVGARLVEAIRPGLAAMTPNHVPGAITALHAFIDGNSRKKASAEELVPELFLATLHVLAEHESIVPKGLDHTAVKALGMPKPVAGAAKTVSEGCRSWARNGPNDLGFLVFQVFTKMLEDGGSVDVDRAVFMLVHFLNTGGDTSVKSDMPALKALADWSVGLMSSQKPGERVTEAAPAPKKAAVSAADVHPVVAQALSAAGTEEPVYSIPRGGSWLASQVGVTSVWASDTVRSRDHVVTPILVDTAFTPRRTPPQRQLAAALSHANVHNGVNAVAWVDGKVHVRTAMAAHQAVNGWLGVYVGVSMMSSAMFALHAAPELRGEPVAGPDGVRNPPSFFVAKLEGFEVESNDTPNHPLPSRDLIETAASMVLREVGEVTRTKDTIECRLPGPNGKLEGWFGRRSGRSDDQQLTISVVTRPPWGAGVKFVLHIPSEGSKEANEDLAMRWNVLEWQQVPAVNVWGGWSGEKDALRLTSFIPQMLFRPSENSNLTTISNFIVYAVGRGNTASVSLNLA